MLVLALDTATPAITAGVVELPDRGDPVERSAQVAHGARQHAELLMPGVTAAAATAGVALRELTAVVVGTGPGPFTGLRVGLVTAAALGDALGLPVHGVCSLDAIAADVLRDRPGQRPLVVTDARRREVYWAAFDQHRRRFEGPQVGAPAALAARIPVLGVTVAAGGSADRPELAGTGLPVRGPAGPSPVGLVAVAAAALRAGTAPGPLEPLYLRRPDAVEPGPRKPVSVG